MPSRIWPAVTALLHSSIDHRPKNHLGPPLLSRFSEFEACRQNIRYCSPPSPGCLSRPSRTAQPTFAKRLCGPRGFVQDAPHVRPLACACRSSALPCSNCRSPRPSLESAGRRTLLPIPASIQSCRQSMFLDRRSPSPSPSHAVPTVATAAVGIGLPVVHPAACPRQPPPAGRDHTLLHYLMLPMQNAFALDRADHPCCHRCSLP